MFGLADNFAIVRTKKVKMSSRIGSKFVAVNTESINQ
jgi:hypothetical protein